MAYTNILFLSRTRIYCSIVSFLNSKHCRFTSIKLKTTDAAVIDADCIDDFTNQLVEEKSNKWDSINIKKINKHKNCNDYYKSSFLFSPKTYIDKINTYREQSMSVDIRNLNTDQIDNLLSNSLDAVNSTDISLITNQCIKYKIIPSIDIFFETISFFSQNGQKDYVLLLQNLCETCNKSIFENNAKMQHYIAEATWIKGNIEDATQGFVDVYRKFPSLRNKVRDMLQQMIKDTVANRSEASLVLVTKFAKSFGLEFNDYFPLWDVWHNCFISDWYSDQQLAGKLFRENETLKVVISDKAFTTAMIELRYHHVETVHRLLELLLAGHMRSQYIQVLHVLFDYKCWAGDLQGCSGIIQSALDLQIPLSSAQHLKFVQLLVGNEFKFSTQKSPTKPPQFQMKF